MIEFIVDIGLAPYAAGFALVGCPLVVLAIRDKRKVALADAHVFGFASTTWKQQIWVWLFYVLVWVRVRDLGALIWDRATKERPQGFIAAHTFRGDTYHTFCQAGSGWGKSSLLKEAIADQVQDCLDGKMSMVVVDDSHLIDEVLAKVDPTERQIRERIILIDIEQAGGPGDVGCLPRLNLLNTGSNSDSFIGMTAKASVFEMVFGSLLEGNETTGPMAAMLTFAAKTLARVKDPTPDDFIRLLRDPHAFIEDLPGLPTMVREYWGDECKPGKPNMTAQALARRAYQMISNDIVHRLLCNPIETVDLGKRLNEGAIVLVATRSGPATAAGARHIGRFMLSVLLRVAMARNENANPLPTVAHVDEFPSYLAGGVDESLLGLLSKARKKRMAVCLYNQEEQQLAPRMISSLLANCGTLIAGGVSPGFAQRLSYQMGIKKIESGPDEGKPNIDLPRLKRRQFAAAWNGREPIIIKSKPDALGDAFHRMPKDGGKEVMARVHRIMREMYAEDPFEVVAEAELKEAQPI